MHMVDSLCMCAVHAEGTWPVRQACMIGRHLIEGVRGELDIHNPCARPARPRMSSLTLSRSQTREAS